MAEIDLVKIEELIFPVLAKEDIELVDLRYLNEGGRWILRFYVDKAGGVTLDDCEKLSRSISAFMDMEDPVPVSYSLEVSSPGLDRVVKKEADFARFAGQRAKVKLREGVDGQRNFRGYLKGAAAGIVRMDFGGQELEFPITDIVEARLDPELKF